MPWRCTRSQSFGAVETDREKERVSEREGEREGERARAKRTCAVASKRRASPRRLPSTSMWLRTNTNPVLRTSSSAELGGRAPNTRGMAVLPMTSKELALPLTGFHTTCHAMEPSLHSSWVHRKSRNRRTMGTLFLFLSTMQTPNTERQRLISASVTIHSVSRRFWILALSLNSPFFLLTRIP
jgi:hypothetical protein